MSKRYRRETNGKPIYKFKSMFVDKKGNLTALSRSIMAILTAYVVGFGTGWRSGNGNSQVVPETPKPIIEVQNDITSMGLSEQTAQKLDDFIRDINNINKDNISKEDILEKCSELNEIRLNCIKEKVSDSFNCRPEDVKENLKITEGDKWAMIQILDENENPIKEFTRGYYWLGRDTMSDEIANIVFLRSTINTIKSDLKTGKLSEERATKRLGRCLEKLKEFSGCDIEFLDGKLQAISYSYGEQENKVDRTSYLSNVPQKNDGEER